MTLNESQETEDVRRGYKHFMALQRKWRFQRWLLLVGGAVLLALSLALAFAASIVMVQHARGGALTHPDVSAEYVRACMRVEVAWLLGVLIILGFGFMAGLMGTLLAAISQVAWHRFEWEVWVTGLLMRSAAEVGEEAGHSKGKDREEER